MDKNPASSRAAIIGAWKLISFQRRPDDGVAIYPFGEEAQGTIIYTETGRFAVQLMRGARPRFAAEDQMQGTVAEIKASFEGCIAYYGSYEFQPEAGYVIHQVEGSLFPNWEGQGLKRFYEFSGDRLRLTTPPTVWGGGGNFIGILEWERIR